MAGRYSADMHMSVEFSPGLGPPEMDVAVRSRTPSSRSEPVMPENGTAACGPISFGIEMSEALFQKLDLACQMQRLVDRRSPDEPLQHPAPCGPATTMPASIRPNSLGREMFVPPPPLAEGPSPICPRMIPLGWPGPSRFGSLDGIQVPKRPFWRGWSEARLSVQSRRLHILQDKSGPWSNFFPSHPHSTTTQHHEGRYTMQAHASPLLYPEPPERLKSFNQAAHQPNWDQSLKQNRQKHAQHTVQLPHASQQKFSESQNLPSFPRPSQQPEGYHPSTGFYEPPRQLEYQGTNGDNPMYPAHALPWMSSQLENPYVSSPDRLLPLPAPTRLSRLDDSFVPPGLPTLSDEYRALYPRFPALFVPYELEDRDPWAWRRDPRWRLSGRYELRCRPRDQRHLPDGRPLTLIPCGCDQHRNILSPCPRAPLDWLGSAAWSASSAYSPTVFSEAGGAVRESNLRPPPEEPTLIRDLDDRTGPLPRRRPLMKDFMTYGPHFDGYFTF